MTLSIRRSPRPWIRQPKADHPNASEKPLHKSDHAGIDLLGFVEALVTLWTCPTFLFSDWISTNTTGRPLISQSSFSKMDCPRIKSLVQVDTKCIFLI